jgi:hypothetical protein
MWKDVAAARHGRSELCLGIGPTAKRITNSTLSQNLEAYLLLFFFSTPLDGRSSGHVPISLREPISPCWPAAGRTSGREKMPLRRASLRDQISRQTKQLDFKSRKNAPTLETVIAQSKEM